MPSRAPGSAMSRSGSASGKRAWDPRERDDAVNDDRARDALTLAESVLAAAMRDGVTEAEALVMTEDSALTRFANSQIHQNVAETNATINLRVVVGKRVGVASSGRTDAEGIARLAQNAVAIARVVEELDDWGGLPGPTEIQDVPEGYSQETAAASPEFRAEAARAVIGAADDAGVVAYGSFATSLESIAVANSNGARAAGTRTTSQLITVSMGPGGGSGYAEAAAVDASTIDASAVGREAAEKARATADAVAIEPGDYPVVLEEYAVVDRSTCSAISGSRPSPSRKVGASPSRAAGSAATS